MVQGHMSINIADCGAKFMLCRECVKCLTYRLEQAEAELKKNSDEWHELWESRDSVIQERERARESSHKYWFELSRIASLCEAPAEETAIKAVERIFKDYAAVKARSRKACQLLISEVGADGPMDVDTAAQRAVNLIEQLRESVPGSTNAIKELERHQAHHALYNAVFGKAIVDGKSIEEAHEIAGKAAYSKSEDND